MLRTSTKLLAIASIFTLQACSNTPSGSEYSGVQDSVPELTLNLPDETCTCVDPLQPDYTFLERGFTALVEGDHIEAVQSFQRYQRLETSPEAEWESAIAIAYVSSLSKSPFYDPDEARKSYRYLRKKLNADMNVHEKTMFMRDSLETFVVMDRHINDLEVTNTILREDLRKREEALKRLRALALGQPAVPQ